MNMLDLSADQLATLRSILARHLPGREVRAFGSRVTGRAWRYSDLDLVLMGSDPVSDLRLATLRAELEDSDLPFRVDLLEERDLPDAWASSFKAHSEPLSARLEQHRKAE
jgi:predicted nucleotidyltransferase